MSGAISFVFSSPRHHAEILLPVVRSLRSRGLECRVISIAELRGMTTPRWEVNGATTHRLMPVRRPLQIPRPPVAEDRPRVNIRGVAQAAVWSMAIGPRLRWLLRGSSAVVIPNDVVFPYLQLVRSLRKRGIPFVLVQEGIRFRLPLENQTIGMYGKNGASKVCVWGNGSADHFRAIGVPRETLCVTGNPRFDGMDLQHWKLEGVKVLAALNVSRAPLLFLSSPIEIQGYGDVELKLELFATFLREAFATLDQHRVPLVVKLHSYEDPAAFRAAAHRLGVKIIVAEDVALFALLASARAAVVTASTAGLEALVFDVPLGVLQIPGHGFAFEYVERGAGIGLTPGTIAQGVETLLKAPERGQRDSRAFVERHLANRGTASEHVSDAVLSTVRRT